MVQSEKEILEKALGIVVEELKKRRIHLTSAVSDGRLNSAVNEEIVVDEICALAQGCQFFKDFNLKIGTPNLESNNNREWYDFSIESANKSINNLFMPINIKITDLQTRAADNLSCKLGIFYALTGCKPKDAHLGNGVNWEQFFEKTSRYMATNKNKDYYFLVVDKQNTSLIFWNSLKCLYSLVANGNNLPFQCVWMENQRKVDRTYEEARDFILSKFGESINKREKIGASFRRHIENHIENKSKAYMLGEA